MSLPIEVAGGSVPGSAHVLAGRNNQDAFCWARTESGLVAIVCDGCGSSSHSDVGANVGARLIVQSAVGLLGAQMEPAALLDRVRGDVVARLRLLASAMSIEAAPGEGDRGSGTATRYCTTVLEHFLFTVVGVIVDERFATTFAFGDGLIVVNNEGHHLGPFPNNEPPYLGYELLDKKRYRSAFDVHTPIPIGELDSLLIGTDGVIELEGMADRQVSGREDHVGGLSQFWDDDRFFRNPDMVRRRLTVLNRGPRGGILSDDTTLVVLRRSKGAVQVPGTHFPPSSGSGARS